MFPGLMILVFDVFVDNTLVTLALLSASEVAGHRVLNKLLI